MNREEALKKISVFLRPAAGDGVIEQLVAQGIQGITLTPVRGCGRQHGHYEFSPWTNTIDVVQKVKLELFVQDAEVEPILTDLQTGAHTGRIGDGKIVVSPESRSYVFGQASAVPEPCEALCP